MSDGREMFLDYAWTELESYSTKYQCSESSRRQEQSTGKRGRRFCVSVAIFTNFTIMRHYFMNNESSSTIIYLVLYLCRSEATKEVVFLGLPIFAAGLLKKL